MKKDFILHRKSSVALTGRPNLWLYYKRKLSIHILESFSINISSEKITNS